MSKKVITKAVHTKAFETTTIKMETASIYTVQQNGPTSYIVCVDGTPCNKQGKPAENVGEVFTYRNEKLAFESLAYFRKCKL